MARALIDGGSQRSYVTDALVSEFNLKVIRNERVNISVFGASRSQSIVCRVVKLTVGSRFDNRSICVEALCVPFIAHGLSGEHDECIMRFHNEGHFLADHLLLENKTQSSDFDILFGSDVYWEIVSGRIQRLSTKLAAVETLFGWTIQGQVESHDTNQLISSCTAFVGVACSFPAHAEHDFWSLETLGINAKEETIDSDVMKRFADSVQFDERYSVRLLFKQGHPSPINDNKAAATNRLNSLKGKLQRNPQLFDDYKQIIADQLQEGICEIAPEHQKGSYYMPHQPVVRDDKSTTKTRIVFDASSHAHGQQSLNDILECGPNLNKDIPEILLRFRNYRYGVTADIKSAFLQICIHADDRKFLQFLWLAPPFTDWSNIAEYRMCRVPFGTTQSPFLLRATINHHIEKYRLTHPKETDILLSQLYVDDLVAGADTPTAAIELSVSMAKILSDARMELRKWHSNSYDVERSVYSHLGQQQDASHVTKVLGVNWNVDDDVLFCEPIVQTHADMTTSPTKRAVLKIVAKLYDPLGILTPFAIQGRIFFQKLWKINARWDDTLNSEMYQRWNAWACQLAKVDAISVPRYIGPIDEKCTLHVFCDASLNAYATCIYAVTESSHGEKTSHLLIAKAQVAPLKPSTLTIPRLELMAALIGSRLWKYVTNAFGHQCYTVFYSDSQIVLAWLKMNPSRLNVFVHNRVIEIQEITKDAVWRYCPTTENPADLATRGITVSQMKSSTLWFHGPEFILRDDDSCNVHESSSVISIPEIKDEATLTAVTASSEKGATIVDWDRYGSANKVIRVIAYVRRFRRSAATGNLNATEISAAKICVLRLAQTEAFPHKMKTLASKQQLPSSSSLAKMNPFLDENGLMRLKGRLQFSNLPDEVKHPIILSGTHPLTRLLIIDAHCALQHGGTTATLVHLRDEFWIIKGRQCVKSVIHRCPLCQRFDRRPGKAPDAPLPYDRMRQDPPFTSTGIDFAGPVYVKQSGQETKAYVALFTCAVTRAIHLEAVSELTTTAFLLAFRRFVSRRGMPRVIYSDNAKTFKRAERDIARMIEMLHEKEVAAVLAQKHISWRYIAERASWWGGFWERMVGLVKHHLRRTLMRASVTYEELDTILIEIEGILNSRPLTSISEDYESVEALTPSHFIIGRRLLMLPQSGTASLEPSSKSQLSMELSPKINLWILEPLVKRVFATAEDVAPVQVESNRTSGCRGFGHRARFVSTASAVEIRSSNANISESRWSL